jgi:putative PIN family toxin of toxin-antitoxin system
MTKFRVILDTNVILSHRLKSTGTITEAVTFAFTQCTILSSQDTFDELRRTLHRFLSKDYITHDEMAKQLAAFIEASEWIPIITKVQQCRDAKDDKFLELAIDGQADYLVTGDRDLLVMAEYKSTRILAPRDFVRLFES